MIILRLLLPLLVMPASATQADKESPSDLAQLQGTWIAEVRTPRKGETMKITLTFKDDTYSMTSQFPNAPKPRVLSGKVVIDGSQFPRHIDLKEPKSNSDIPAPSKDLLAIYKLEGSTLTLAVPVGLDAPRPTDFPEDTGQGPPRVIVFEKQKETSVPKE